MLIRTLLYILVPISKRIVLHKILEFPVELKYTGYPIEKTNYDAGLFWDTLYKSNLRH